ncbi:MAG: lytic transglycosylase domain-containing protein [Gemmatimonadota bacterium]|nr:lytic transglycosylase domain-containing protein [Gemmatimonadota bacterium]
MIRTNRTRTLLRHALLGLGAAGTVVFVAGQIRPVFVGRSTVVQQLTEPLRDDDVALVGVPLTHSLWIPKDAARPKAGSAPASRRSAARFGFEADRRAFVQDLLATGHVGSARAWRIADAAVRQAYALQIPPALVLGVMLTENTTLKPSARSNVGAQGLMQIMPRLWKPVLGRRYGRDLRDDATNVRYGIHILRYMHDRVSGRVGPDASYRTALLRYNGCVRGRNTKNCHRYPDVVQRYVLRNAKSICRDRTFRECVVMPLYRSRWGSPQRVASAN